MRRLAITIIVAMATATAAAGQGQRLITETDILKFVWIAEGQISPDGKSVAFTRVTINEDKDDYESSLWIVPADGSGQPRVLTSGTHDTSPRWSPDGKGDRIRANPRKGRQGAAAADLPARARWWRGAADHRPGAWRERSGLGAGW